MEASLNLVPAEQYRTGGLFRARGRPPQVSDLDQLHQALRKTVVPQYTRTVDGHELLSFRCLQNDSLMITTRRQLDLLSTADLIHADATYKVVPKGFGVQLFTRHANMRGQESVSLLL